MHIQVCVCPSLFFLLHVFLPSTVYDSAVNLSLPGRAVGALLGDIRADLITEKTWARKIQYFWALFIMRVSTWNQQLTNLAGECIGELVRFLSFRMSCIFPPLLSHSTLKSSTFRFWWAEAASSLKVKAGNGKEVRFFFSVQKTEKPHIFCQSE